MSLDKQRILSELGSVMNQLQSADCGCMGKLFNNGGQGGCQPMGNPLPTCGGCRRGCCPGHGFGVNYASIPSAGEPFSMNAGGMGGGGMHPEGMHGGMSDGMQGGMNDGMHGGMHGGMPGGMHGGMQGGMHSGMRGGMRNGIQEVGMPMGMGTRNAGWGGMNCMMGRNAPKLYADTYNYLNKNMMQPTMQEVYNDLKSITPENTVASNPLANQMGLSTPGGMNQGNAGAMGGQMPSGGMGGQMHSGGMGGQMPSGGMDMPGGPGNPMTSHNTPHLGGMGENIVNMMMSGGGGMPKGMPQGGQLKDPMLIDAPHSPHGQVGITPIAAGGNMGMAGMTPGGAPGQPNDGNMAGMPGMGQGNPAAMMANPTTQYVTQDNMHEMNAMPQGRVMPQANAMPGQGMSQGNNMIQGNMMQGNPMQQGNVMQQGQAMQQGQVTPQSNPVGNTPGMMKMGQQGQSYGIHSAGIKKFNEMFPGVMQGDLNFDPMAIAVQMNPANQKQAAIDTMTKLMNGNRGQAMLQPVLRGANAAYQQLSAAQGGQEQSAQGQQQTIPGQQIPGSVLQPNQQQVYAVHTGAPAMNQQMTQQQIPQQQIQGQEYQQGQQHIDPNTGAAIEGTEVDPKTPQEGAPEAEQRMTNEITDPSKNTIAYNMTPQYNNVQYNTLGQPVNLLPGTQFHSPTPGLPQTLNGTYRGDLQQQMGVKNTMSKTAIAGSIPVGATASRSQLQHYYRQLRATQNIKSPVQGGSASAGNLNVAHMRTNAAPPAQQIPMEKVGGDSMANNPDQPKMEQGLGQVAEAPAPGSNTPHGDTIVEKSPAMVGKTRNGLQDMAFTAYRGTAAWSFHG